MPLAKLSLVGTRKVPFEWVPHLPSRVFDNMTKNMIQVVNKTGGSVNNNPNVDLQPAVKWCEENCQHRWAIHEVKKIFYFESRVEATMFVTASPDVVLRLNR